MTASLHGLRLRAGQTQVELDAFELDHGTRLKDPAMIRRHDALLRQNEESQRWLRVAQANLDGRMNFIPKNFPRTKTKKTTTTEP